MRHFRSFLRNGRWVPLVFGDCERLVVLAVVAYTADAAGSSVRANFSTEES